MQFPKVSLDLEYGQGSCYGPEEEAAVVEVIRAGAPGYGPKSREFEQAFAEYCGVSHALAVSSGTAALQLAMLAAEVGPGDEVITTPLSWISTANGAALRGARVVFADIDPRTLTLDPESVARKITPRTKALIAVHLYGQCCDMDALLALTRPRGIRLIEDCAHAPGAEYRGCKAGSMGDLAIFSFGQQKNMGTLGEGGMVITNDGALCDQMRSYRWLCCHGYDPQGKYSRIDEQRQPMGQRYWHLEFDDIGYNLRMTDAQAAVGLVQLRKLDDLNARRIRIAAEYSRRLAGTPGLTLPYAAPDRKHVFHVYCVLVEPEMGLRKEEFMWQLYTQKQIKPLNHYMLIHLTEAYRKLGHGEGECPVAEALFPKYVSLPIHPRLTAEAVEYLARSVREIAEAGARQLLAATVQGR
ncbi:MAG TPA: DegT/DnrJ/EryC1/StrS family aminotransferase [Bryobacteraceae bacterium]|nr:DegT/DnrJ/EryC1/StrS family aminotransferase [Bryobacteraceae bacterium]